MRPRVLIADEDDKTLAVAGSLLKEAGMEFVLARTGRSALKAAQNVFDLIITECEIEFDPAKSPGEKINLLEAYKTACIATPIVLYTALEHSSVIVSAAGSQLPLVKQILRKPLALKEPQNFLTAVRATLIVSL
ncbi:MAG TPA: hypothetical protein VHD55_00400 [Candidatus Paceibacterota bacterium]|nr:hypothetical protein [Candidatus Paceibacterota bacterium]